MIKPPPEQIESNSLEKVTSTILHPLTSHSEIPQFGRARSRSSPKKTPSRSLSQERDREHGSDEGWSMVSDGSGFGLESPPHKARR